jgi:hypothetical protein
MPFGGSESCSDTIRRRFIALNEQFEAISQKPLISVSLPAEINPMVSTVIGYVDKSFAGNGSLVLVFQHPWPTPLPN